MNYAIKDILAELDITNHSTSGVHAVQFEDKLFIGGGCEKPWVTNDKTQTASFKNIAICVDHL